MPLCALLSSGLLRADSPPSFRPVSEAFFEERSRNPKVAGVGQLTPVPAGQYPRYFRRLSFAGERHLASGPLKIGGTTSWTTYQTRGVIGGAILYRYDAATDTIVVRNESFTQGGSVNTAPWEYEELNWPLSPVLTVEVPLSAGLPIGYNTLFVAANNPLGLAVRSAVQARDDNVLIGSVGGYNAVAAIELQDNFQMVLEDEEDPTEEIERRARVARTGARLGAAVCSTWRETRRPASTAWRIREITVTYRLRTCPGDHFVKKVFRKRRIDVPNAPWDPAWSETEMVQVKSVDDRDRVFELPLEDDHEIELVGLETMPAPGCGGGCGAGGMAGGSAGPQNGSIHWLIPLGTRADGASAGALLLHRPHLSAEIYSPAALELALAEGTALKDAAGGLRQILVPQALVDVVVLSAQAYELRFHERSRAGSADASGFHVPTGSPYLTWRIENPAGGGVGDATGRLRVTRLAASESVVTEIDESQPGRRIFSEGGGLRVTETTASSWVGSRVETIVVRDAAGAVATKRQVHIQQFPWGAEKVREVVDPDRAALVTEWTYGTMPNLPAYRQVIKVRRPDGSEEQTLYDNEGYTVRQVSPVWANAALEVNRYFRRVDLDGDGILDRLTSVGRSAVYNSLGLEWIVEWGGLSAAGQRRRDHFQARTDAAQWNTPGNLRTRERYNATDGELVYRLAPDGVLTLRQRTIDAAGNTVLTEQRGAADAANEAVVDGTRTVTVTTPKGQVWSTVVTDIATGRTLEAMSVAALDELGRPIRLTHPDGAVESRDYCAACGEVGSIALRGVTTDFLFDALGRRTDEIRRAGGTVLAHTRQHYDAEGRVVQTVRVDRATGAETVLAATTYDLAGRVLSEYSPARGTTTYAYAFGPEQQTVVTTTFADGGTRIETRGAGGALLAVRGTAAAPVDTQYVGGGQGYLIRTLRRNDNGTVLTEEQAINLLGQVESIRYPNGAWIVRSFDAGGRLVREVDPDGVGRLLAYDALGQLAVTAVDLNRNGLIDYAGTDRITRTRREVGVRDGLTVRREISELWETDNVDQPTTVAIAETSVDGLRSWRTVRGLTTAAVTVYDGAGGQTVTTTRPDGTVVEQRYLGDRLLEEITRHPTLGALGSTTYAYDAAGRLLTQTDARGGVTTYAYDGRDRLVAVTAPDPDLARSGPGYDAPTVSYGYDAVSRVTTTTMPDGGVVTTRYLPTGQVQRTAGARTFPIEYTYDLQGRLKTMTTWRDFAGDAGRAVTTWSYDDLRGWLTDKRYADGNGPTYGYSAAGRLVRRTWARGVTTTYSYNNAGEVRQTSYSDATPAVTLDHDRAGRVRGLTDGSGQRTLGYDAVGALRSESYTTGLLAGAGIERSYDAWQRLAGLTATLGGPVAGVAYTYDAASRLQALASGTDTVAYSYLPNSGLLAGVSFARSGVERLRTTRSYDRRGRLTAVASEAAGATVSHAYAYDAADQRARVTREDGSYWAYGYDALGQVTAGRKFRADEAPALGLDFAWAFDDIGNRRTAATNGQTSAYAANALNQYGQRTVPGVVEVLGAAAADAAVVIGGAGPPQLASRQGESYFGQLPVANDETAQVVPLRVAAMRDPAGAATLAVAARAAWVPKTPEVFTHDAEGSLVGDGRWSYSWDAENRLTGMETRRAAAAQGWPRQKLEFVYDAQSRRVRKRATSQTAAGLINQAASFFPNETLSGAPVVTTRDGAIDGYWSGPPDAALPSDGWSLRVTARLRVPVGGSWTFSAPVRGDDALRLYLDERLLLDAWTYGAPAPRATVMLDAERDYVLRFEFKDGGSVAQAQLRWSGPGITEQVIPNAAEATFGVRVAETRFLYDGWSLLAELDAAGALVRTYLWGLDVSGTRQDAGGVGGLVGVTDAAAGGTHFVASDGNGNVAALVRAADGGVAGRYDYHAFGETVELNGEAAAANPFRFSTKYTDAETGLLYYGFRYYDPAHGRWLGRDPYEESGGVNLYGFVQNSPTTAVDPLGLALYAFDGTGNNGYRDQKNGTETNVFILFNAYRGPNSAYLPGVGTNDGLLNPLGLAFGLGGISRVEEMLEKAEQYISGGDPIVDIIGFSRGAVQARTFANRVLKKFPCVKIRWIGLFDSVASEGVPGDINLGYKLGIPSEAGRVLHLTAGGERRKYTFALTSILPGLNLPHTNPNFQEVSIPGAVHSDVGGGYGRQRGLANYSLALMWQDGIAHGVPFGSFPASYSNFQGEPNESRWPHDKLVEFITQKNRVRKVFFHP